MELNNAKIIANRILADYCLNEQGWKFEFDNAKVRFGCCKYRSKTITLSKHLVLLNDIDAVLDTILHEIAHALAGYSAGHGNKWKQIAKDIGCTGDRCYNPKIVNTPESKYYAFCFGCRHTYTKHRTSSRNQSCGECGGNRYNPNFKLDWKINPNYK